jgi:hypothetical protein
LNTERTEVEEEEDEEEEGVRERIGFDIKSSKLLCTLEGVAEAVVDLDSSYLNCMRAWCNFLVSHMEVGLGVGCGVMGILFSLSWPCSDVAVSSATWGGRCESFAKVDACTGVKKRLTTLLVGGVMLSIPFLLNGLFIGGITSVDCFG